MEKCQTNAIHSICTACQRQTDFIFWSFNPVNHNLKSIKNTTEIYSFAIEYFSIPYAIVNDGYTATDSCC